MYFRGFKILEAVIDSVLATAGADKIEQVILTGCSGIACVFSKALAEKHRRFTRSVLNCHIYNISIIQPRKFLLALGVYTIYPIALYLE